MITLIRNRVWTPERIAKNPRKVRGGYIFRHPPSDLWRYNQLARNQAIREWAMFGASALASAIGGTFVTPPLVGALVSDGPFPFPPDITSWIGVGQNTITLDAAGEYHANVYAPLESGKAIDRVEFLTGTASGSPTVDVQLETLDPTNGRPSGTVLGATGNAKLADVACSSNAWTTAVLDETYTVTRGTKFAAVVRYKSGTSIQTRNANTNVRTTGHHYVVENPGSVSKGGMSAANIVCRFTDGTYLFAPGTMPTDSTTYSENMTSGSVNHRGNVYLNPAPKRAVGGVFLMPSSSIDYGGVIAADSWDGTADNDGSSNISVDIDCDETNEAATQPVWWISSSFLEMQAGGDYRTLLKATQGGSITLYRYTVNAAAILDVVAGGRALHWTEAHNPTGAGDWTDTPTKRAIAGFWFDQIDDGAGGGGGLKTHPGFTGGFNG